MKNLLVGLFAVSVVALACSSETTPPEPTATAAQHLRENATYLFVLEESSVAEQVRAKCAGDAACFERVRARGAREGMRFTTDASGRVTLRSFGTDEDGKEEVFAEAPLAVDEVDARTVRVTAAPNDVGTHPWRDGMTHTVTWLDDRTMVMEEGNRGRYVYRR